MLLICFPEEARVVDKQAKKRAAEDFEVDGATCAVGSV